MKTKTVYRFIYSFMLGLGICSVLAASRGAERPVESVRLYVFDNGCVQVADPRELQFKKDELANVDMAAASYLIVHPKGTLMWDTGMIADGEIKDDGSVAKRDRRIYVYTATKSLRSQLTAIGYAPKDVTFLALSHSHTDHTANANDFAGSTWLVQQPEYDHMFSRATAATAPYAKLKNSRTQILRGEDYDVFGDGTVIVKAAYGHTPGHQVLLVKLRRTGLVILTGDLYHYPEERGTTKVPSFEFNKEQSLASRAAIEAFVKKTGAQLWIEHDLGAFSKMKKAPDYYD